MNNKEVEKQIHDFSVNMYHAGYDDGYKDGAKSGYITSYNEGLNDAWGCAKKLALMSSDSGFDNKTVKEIFGTTNCYSIFEKMSVSTVVAKIKDYEEQQKRADDKIRVGDEVILNEIDCKAIVVISILEGCEESYNILFGNGDTDWVRKSAISKTGKHYDAIEEVLKELRRDEE